MKEVNETKGLVNFLQIISLLVLKQTECSVQSLITERIVSLILNVFTSNCLMLVKEPSC